MFIVLDRERKLRYDINAICDFEEVMESSLGKIMINGLDSIRTVRALLWAGLKHEDKGITIARVGMLMQEKMADGKGLDYFTDPILQALQSGGLFGKKGNAETEAAKK